MVGSYFACGKCEYRVWDLLCHEAGGTEFGVSQRREVFVSSRGLAPNWRNHHREAAELSG